MSDITFHASGALTVCKKGQHENSTDVKPKHLNRPLVGGCSIDHTPFTPWPFVNSDCAMLLQQRPHSGALVLPHRVMLASR